jgi:hypothetical protein
MELPVTIYKSWVGYILILLVGLTVAAVPWVGIFMLGYSDDLDDTSFWMLVITRILVLVVMVERLYVYTLSYITLTKDGIKAENWSSLFYQVDVESEWVRVQDVSIQTSNLFSLLLSFGTVTIQTAGTAQDRRMTMVPNVEALRDLISRLADQATGSDQLIAVKVTAAELTQ